MHFDHTCTMQVNSSSQETSPFAAPSQVKQGICAATKHPSRRRAAQQPHLGLDLQGYALAGISALLSALAAVYTEWALKRNADSLYWQNMQLYSWGFLCNAVALTINDLRQGARRCPDAKAMAAAQMCLRTEADNLLISPCGRRWARSVVYTHVGRLQLGHLPGGPEPGLQRPAGLLDHEARRLHRQGVHSSVARLRTLSLYAAVLHCPSIFM